MHHYVFTMRFLNMRNYYTTIAIGLLATQINLAQEVTNTTEKTEIANKLLELKTELGENTVIDKIYKIQLYSGAKANTEEASKEFTEKFPEWNFEINYEYPNYKLRAGAFRNRLEAEKHLIELKEVYPNALIINP